MGARNYGVKPILRVGFMDSKMPNGRPSAELNLPKAIFLGLQGGDEGMICEG